MITLDDYVVDVLMRDLVGHDRRLVSFLVYLWFAAEQRRGEVVEASYQQIAESIGVSKSSAQAAVGWLIKKKIAGVDKKDGDGHTAVSSAGSLARAWEPRAAAE